MLRLIGALMVVGATAAAGFSKMQAMSARVRAIEAFISALETISAETRYRLTELPALLEMLALTAAQPAAGFFAACAAACGDMSEQSLYPAWRQALDGVTCLEKADREAIGEAGAVLGRYDEAGQAGGLALASEKLRRCLEGAMEREIREGRMYGTLGICSGLAAVIILL